MDCLTGIIGIKDLCAKGLDESWSGWYIEDLGFTLSNLAQTANLESEETAIELINNKINFATKEILLDINKFLYKDIGILKQKQIFSTKVSSFSAYDYLPMNPVNRGVVLRKNSLSSMGRIYIERIKIKVKSNATQTLVTILDGNNSTDYLINIIEGEICEIATNYTAQSDTVYITLNDINLQVNKSSLLGGCMTCGNAQKGALLAWGWDGTKISQQTYGISADVSLLCTDEPFICAIKEHLGLPILYKTGILLVQEKIFSDRINGVTLNSERNQAQLDLFISKYEDTLLFVLNSLREYILNYDKKCFVCTDMKVLTQK